MADRNDLFKIDQIEVDFKNFEKIRLKASQNDTVILSFLVYNYNSPVDLSQYNYEARFFLPNGNLYSEENNLTVDGNILTISCDSTLTQAVGEVNGTLRLWTKDEKQTSLYKIIIKVYSVGEQNTVSKSTISVLEHLDISINRAIELSKSFDDDMKIIVEASKKANDLIKLLNDENNKITQNINNGKALNKELKTALEGYENRKDKIISDIDGEIGKANDTKTNLENTYATANNWITKIDEKTKTAKDNCDLLDNKNNLADENKTKLNEACTIAEEKLEEFRKFDTDGLVQKNQTMLDELICNNELCDITFNSDELGLYPILQLLFYENGYGMGGFGEGQAGSSSPECNLMQSKVVYVNDSVLRIYVPNKNYIKNKTIEKKDDYEYLLSSTDNTDARCVLIKLRK